MRVDPARHRAQPWRVHSLAPDFELLDVWEVPIRADPTRGETFDRFFEIVWENGLDAGLAAKMLLSLRKSLGRFFRWDREEHLIPGSDERSVAERLSEADRSAILEPGRGPRATGIWPVRVIYRYQQEALLEPAPNATIAVLLHLGWVDTGEGRKTAELAVYIKSRGLRSRVYMSLIEPFRLLFVYPPWIARITRAWRERTPRPDRSSAQ
jgi:hypothetical protein